MTNFDVYKMPGHPDFSFFDLNMFFSFFFFLRPPRKWTPSETLHFVEEKVLHFIEDHSGVIKK